jgi:F-type H+-transporting ATPase subunit delta
LSVASTYAEALFESATDTGAVDAVASDLAQFATAVEESAELRDVIDNPEVDRRAKRSIIDALTEGADPLLANFLKVLVDRGRLTELREIADAFAERVDRAEARLEVEAITAIPLPADLRDRIVEEITRKTGQSVVLSESVDPEIVGGLVLKVGELVVDGSVRHDLDRLAERLHSVSVDAALAPS